jgi:hypothetical protein
MKKISDLVRTNIALAALCIISIGVLVIVFRGSGDTSHVAVVQPSTGSSYQQSYQSSGQNYPTTLTPEKDLPASSTFPSFIYEAGKPISVSGSCADMYKVLIIFPSDVDYRQSPLFAKYNGATPCTMGEKYSYTMDLTPLNLESGTSYYYVKASEGKTGSWHDPY